MKTLHTKTHGAIEMDDKAILCNDVTLPQEFNPHNVRLWVIGHEFGAIVAIWASCEQDALDEMLDKGYEHFLVENPEPDNEEYAFLGNAGEACDLSYAWMAEVEFDLTRDYRLLIAFAEARGACKDTL